MGSYIKWIDGKAGGSERYGCYYYRVLTVHKIQINLAVTEKKSNKISLSSPNQVSSFFMCPLLEASTLEGFSYYRNQVPDLSNSYPKLLPHLQADATSVLCRICELSFSNLQYVFDGVPILFTKKGHRKILSRYFLKTPKKKKKDVTHMHKIIINI